MTDGHEGLAVFAGSAGVPDPVGEGATSGGARSHDGAPAEAGTTDGPTAPAVREPPGWYDGLGRRWRVALWLLLVAWTLGGAVVLGDWTDLRVGRDAGTSAAEPEPSTALLVVRSEGDARPAVLLVHHVGATGNVVMLPAATVVETPGAGPRSLVSALDDHGPAAFATAVANALGIRVPEVSVAGPEALRAAVAAVGPVPVDVPETIEVESEGILRTLYTAGRTVMDADAYAAFVSLDLPEEGELERLARQSAAWRGLFTALRDADVSAVEGATASWSGGLGASELAGVLVDTARAERLSFHTLPVVRVPPTSEDLYEVDRDSLDPVRTALATVATVERRDGRRVRLLVGAEGDVGPAVARLLVESGYVIVLTGKASEPYDVTRVVIAENSDELRATGRQLLDLLGTGRLGVFRRPQTVFDATLVVGRDWAEANGFPQPTPAPPRRGRR